jgi:hypothetical protein
MNDPAARAIASIAVSLATGGIAWASPNFAGLAVAGLAGTIYFIWTGTH